MSKVEYSTYTDMTCTSHTCSKNHLAEGTVYQHTSLYVKRKKVKLTL